MNFKDKAAVVTGGARGIGKAVADAFVARGAKVCTIGPLPNDFFAGDLAGARSLDAFAQKVLKKHGKIDCLVNNAMLSMGGITSLTHALAITLIQGGFLWPTR